MPTTAEMSKRENWVHYAKNILKNNKTGHTLTEEVEDRDAAVLAILN